MNFEYVSDVGDCVRFRMIPLTPEYLDAALSLCDKSVGENLYSRQELQQVIASPNRYFYLAVLDDGSVAGYMYFYLEQAQALPVYAKLDSASRTAAGLVCGKRIGNLQSIGVRSEHRRTGLSLYMMQFAINLLQTIGADTLLGVCWKQGTTVPMQKIMNDLQFVYLCDIEQFWYDKSELCCPHCGGQCKCAAAVYFKTILKERSS